MLHKTVCAVVINYTSESDVLCSSLVVYFWICMQEGKIGERERKQQQKTDGNGIVVSILEYGSCHIHKLNSHHLLVFCFCLFFAFVVFVGLS